MNYKNKINFYEIELFNNIKINSSKSIVWGNFEYISFKKAKQFNTSTTCTRKNAHAIVIPNSRVYIYDCSPLNTLYFKEDNEQGKGIFKSNEKEYYFIGVSLFNFHENILATYLPEIAIKNGQHLIQTVCKTLIGKLNQISAYKDLKFDVFGALNSYDICVICLFNNIGDYIEFVESIQNVKTHNGLNLFESSYSMLTSPFLDGDEEVFLNSKNGYANIQITYNSCASFEGIVSYIFHKLKLNGNAKNKGDKLILDEVNVFSTLGEFDIVIQLPINLLNNKVYCELLNPKGSFYQGHIQQCNTRFSLKKDVMVYDDIYINREDQNANESKKCDVDSIIKVPERKYLTLSKTKLYKFNNCICEIYDMLWNDFRRALSMSKRHRIWREDLTSQFVAIIDLASNFLDGNDKSSAFKYSLYLVNVFKESIYHLNQSNSPDLNAIQSLFRSVATYDKIINCYYFIVKNILRTVYLFGNTQQSELIPFINFKTVPIINSELISCSGISNTKILSIDLPYDTFYNIDKYIPFLYHEIGHYVCPQNRIERNYYFYIIIMVVWIRSHMLDNYNIIDLDYLTLRVYNSVLKYSPSDITRLYQEPFSQVWESFYKALKNGINAMWNLDSELFFQGEDIPIWCKELSVLTNKVITEVEKDLELELSELNIKPVYDSKVFASLIYWDLIDNLVIGLREAMADTFMIENTFMNLDEYIALFIYSRSQQAWQYDGTGMSSVRVGTILESFITDVLEGENDMYELHIFSDELKNDVLNLCEKLIPNCDLIKIQEEYTKLMRDYIAYQQDWRLFINLFLRIKCTVVFNADIEELRGNNSLALFYNKMQTYDLSKQLSDPKYLEYINLSYYQPTLQGMHAEKEKRKKNNNDKSKYLYLAKNLEYLNADCIRSSTIPTYYLSRPQDFNFAIRLISQKIGEKNDVLWYRGQTQEWPLNPNLFRKVKTNRLGYLRDLYNEFVAQSADSPELVGAIRTEADWLSYMQHYDVPTNFLDWSEQALSALYFALENYFVPPCKHNPDDKILSECANDDLKRRVDYTKDSVVWILNPVRMNRVIYGDNLNMSIPNLSIKNTITDTNTERFLINENKQSSLVKDYPRYAPMAISTAKISNRIRTQKGHFVAFDVNISDVINGKCRKVKRYKGKKEPIINLKNKIIKIIPNKTPEDLVKYHEYLFSKNSHGQKYLPFLAKLIIPLNIKRDLVDYLKHMGISLSSIYPELTNIGKDVTKRCNNLHVKGHS